MPEPTTPESDPHRTSPDPFRPTGQRIPWSQDDVTALLQQLSRLANVQYAAHWPFPTVNSMASGAPQISIAKQPQAFDGQASERLSLPQRQMCLQQVLQMPNQPFLLSDKSASGVSNQSALVGMVATFPANRDTPTVEISSIFEIQFAPHTSMQSAVESLQTVAQTLQQADWKLWATYPPKPKAAPSSKNRFEFAGQTGLSGFSAGGLMPGKPFSDQTTQAATESPPSFDLRQFQSLARQVHRSLDPHETDLNVCNELASFLECDRVSVVRKHRGKFQIQAISGQTSVNKRSKIVQQLQDLSASTLKLKQRFHAPGDTSLPKEIRSPLDSYLLTSDVRSIAIVPVMAEAKELLPEQADLRDTDATNSVIAGIIIETLKKEINFQNRPEVQTACEIGSDAIRASHQHRQLFLYPVWHWLGRTKTVALSRRLPLSIIASLAIIAVLTLAFWPATFYVSSEGTLVPEARSRIFSPLNGIIEEIYVKPQQHVTAGQPLIRMRDFELESQLQKTQRELASVTSKIEVQEYWLRSDGEKERYVNQQEETPLPVLKNERDNLLTQLELLNEQEKLMLVTSRIDGTVMTWRVDEELLRRPVPFGRLMMEIAQVNGKWKVMLNLPDRRIGHLLNAIKESDQPLKVEFVLAARPEQRYYGTLSEVALTTAASQEDGSFVKLEVDVNSDDLQILQNETEVSAKIFCGQASLGYVWLHDIREFVQKKVFFFTW